MNEPNQCSWFLPLFGGYWLFGPLFGAQITFIVHSYLHFFVSLKFFPIELVDRAFASGLRDQGSILDQVIPNTQKIVLDATLLNTQHYKVQIKGKA